MSQFRARTFFAGSMECVASWNEEDREMHVPNSGILMPPSPTEILIRGYLSANHLKNLGTPIFLSFCVCVCVCVFVWFELCGVQWKEGRPKLLPFLHEKEEGRCFAMFVGPSTD